MQKLVIIRGLPGSGKSTFAKKYIKDYQLEKWKEEKPIDTNLNYPYVYLSADDYFTTGNQYLWDSFSLQYAHQRCAGLCNSAMEKQIPLIIIDNTNIVYSQYKPYLEMAEMYLYDIEIHSLYTSGLTAKELAKKNNHGVTEEKIQEMINKYQPRNFYSTKEAKEFFDR